MSGPRRCFITGATGFLGRRLVSSLQASEPALRLRCLTRRPAAALPAGVESFVGGLCDATALRRGMEGCEAVVHLAAVTRTNRLEEYLEVNAEGTRRVVAAAEEAKVRRLVFASSRAIAEGCGAYACSKRAAEEAVREGRVPYVIFRFAEIYGPGGGEGIGSLLAWVRKAPIVPVIPGARLAPVFVDDAIAVLLKSLNPAAPTGGVYTIAGPRSYAFDECVKLIASAIGRRRWCLPLSPALFRALVGGASSLGWSKVKRDQVERLLCDKEDDIRAAAADFGFAPRRFEAGLQRLLQEACG